MQIFTRRKQEITKHKTQHLTYDRSTFTHSHQETLFYANLSHSLPSLSELLHLKRDWHYKLFI